MRHTPLGYDVIDGKIVVNEEEAQVVRTIMLNYISGMTLTQSAEAVGLVLTHSSVKHILTNKRYLGDGFYPRIIEDETALAVENEMKERAVKLGRDNKKKRKPKVFTPQTSFKTRPGGVKYDDPIAQAEYAYSLIEGEVI